MAVHSILLSNGFVKPHYPDAVRFRNEELRAFEARFIADRKVR